MVKRALIFVAVLSIALADLSIDARHAAAAEDGVAIIVNKANPTADLTLADAKKIFMGDKSTWPNGKRITVLMLAQGQPERAVVLRVIYKMSEADYGKYFLQAAFTGKVSAPPKDVASPAVVKGEVGANPGAVGYVKASEADDSVKIVLKIS
jgi:ABC-type phosphate transport system substrate-binding protein